MDPIVLIAQIHASGPEAAEQLKSAGLGDLTALSQADPKRVAEILGVKQKSAEAIVQDAVREREKGAAPSPPQQGQKKKKKAAASGSSDGVTRQETEALLSEGRADAATEETAAGGKGGSTVEEGPPPDERPESFWQFG